MSMMWCYSDPLGIHFNVLKLSRLQKIPSRMFTKLIMNCWVQKCKPVCWKCSKFFLWLIVSMPSRICWVSNFMAVKCATFNYMVGLSYHVLGFNYISCAGIQWGLTIMCWGLTTICFQFLLLWYMVSVG